MNITRVETFFRELGQIYKMSADAKAQVDMINGMLATADGPSQLAQVEEFRKRRDHFQAEHERLLSLAADRAKRSPERVHEYIVDLEVRIDAYHESLRTYRRVGADVELLISQGVSDEDRKHLEEKLAMAKAQLEKREQFASNMIPERPIVLTP